MQVYKICDSGVYQVEVGGIHISFDAAKRDELGVVGLALYGSHRATVSPEIEAEFLTVLRVAVNA